MAAEYCSATVELPLRRSDEVVPNSVPNTQPSAYARNISGELRRDVSPKRRSRGGGLHHFLAQMHPSFACFELRLGRTFAPATTNSGDGVATGSR